LPKPVARNPIVPLDVPGIFLAPIAFASLTYGISESTTAGWTGLPTLAGVAVGLVAFVLFVARELTCSHPLLELRVFRNPDYARGTLVQWISFTGLFGTMFLVPLFLQQVRGYSPLETGLYMLPGAVTTGIMMQFSGRLFDRVGVKIPATAGLILCSCGMLLLSRISPSTTGSDLALPMILQGSGLGLFGMPLNAYLLSTVPRDLISRLTSLLSACQNLVGSLAIATFATILQARMASATANAGPGGAPANMAAAFGSIYQMALVALLVGLALVLTLRRHASSTDWHQSQEIVGSRVADASAAPWA
jgi:MFS family permease